jgi:hypothetical protein
LGVAVPMIVFASVSQEALFVWGWRVPFLASVVTAGVALLLRTLMVEPDEFVEQRDRELLLLAAAEAAAGGEGGDKDKAASASADKGAAAAAAAGGAAPPEKEDAGRIASYSSETPLATVAVRPSSAAVSGGVGGVKAGMVSENGGGGEATAATAAAAAAPPAGHWWQRATCRRRSAASGLASSGPTPTPRRAHRAIPVRAAFTQHGGKIALQCLFTAASTASAFAFTAWLPLLYLTPPTLMPRMLAYGMVLVIVAISIPVGIISARVCDRGLARPMTLSMCAILLGAGVILTFFLVAVPRLAHPGTHGPLIAVTLACVVPHNVVYGSLANVMGRIYPASIRVTAFSTGHNVASSVFGGFAPLIMNALQTAWPWTAPAIYLACLCAVSVSAGLLMVRLFPGMNALPAEAELLRAAERAAAEAEAAEAGAGAGLPAPGANGAAGGAAAAGAAAAPAADVAVPAAK